MAPGMAEPCKRWERSPLWVSAHFHEGSVKSGPSPRGFLHTLTCSLVLLKFGTFSQFKSKHQTLHAHTPEEFTD